LCRSLRRCRLDGGAVAAEVAGGWDGGMGSGCGGDGHGERRGDTAEKLGCRDSWQVHDRARFCDRVTCPSATISRLMLRHHATISALMVKKVLCRLVADTDKRVSCPLSGWRGWAW